MRTKRLHSISAGLILSLVIAIPVLPASGDGLLKNLPTRDILSNGLTFIYQKDESSSTSVVQIVLQGGKRMEPAGLEGLAFLTTRLCLDLPDQRVLQRLMNQATNRTFNCQGDFSVIRISCLSGNLKEAIELSAQILRDPLISGIRIERIKEFMDHYRKLQEDEPINIAHAAALEGLFAGSPYAGATYGTEKSLKDIKKRDVEDFFNTCTQAGNMIVVISTDLEKEETLGLLRPYFEAFPQGKGSDGDIITFSRSSEKSLVLTKDTQQTLVYTAFPLPGISRKNFILSMMLENLLGKGMNSRLWPLRTDKKLAYIVNSRAFLMREGGLIEAYLETDQTKKDTAVSELDAIMRDLYQNGVPEEEFLATKVHTKGMALRENETKNSRTYNLAYLEALGLGYDFLNRLLDEIDRTTLDEFHAFIRDVLDPDKAMSIIIGPNR